MTLKKTLASLALAFLIGAVAGIAAESPIAIPSSWELRLIATNGKDCAFSFIDKGGSPSEIFLQVGQRRLGPFARIENLGWSPDGSTLGFCAGDSRSTTVYVNEKPRGVFDEVWEFMWAPRGGDLAVVGKRDNREVLELNSGSVDLYDFARGPLEPGTGFRDGQWSPDGAHLYFVFASDYVSALPWDGLKPMVVEQGIRKLAISPDGRTIAYCTAKALYRGGKEIASGVIADFAWAPDSRRLAYAKRAGGGANSFDIYIDSAKAASVQVSSFRRLCWSPDGKEWGFEYVDSKKDRYFNRNGKILGPFVDDYLILCDRWSADSRHFAYPTQKKGMGPAWQLLVDNSYIGPFPGKPLLPASPWSSDGSRIAFSIVGTKEGSGLYIDGKRLIEGSNINVLAWAAGSSILAYSRDDAGIASSKLLIDGNEVPGAAYKDSIASLVNGLLSVGKAR
jgi:hypothetical protein